jgi:CRISPR-associated protein Cas1
MRRLLNTIYVMSEDAWLRKDGANLVVEVDGAEHGRAPLHMLEGIVSFSRPGASPALLAACAAAGITLSHLDPNGRFLARVEGPRTGNVLLRRAQYRVADDPARALPIVRGIVAAKAANQRTVIRRALRDHGDTMREEEKETLGIAERRLSDIARRTLPAAEIDVLRGLEGEAASVYFDCFPSLLRVNDDDFAFRGRSRRPPLDRVNALLSFLYALLGHDCRSALEAYGLDPQVGLLHADRPGRASLALDLMEELRPVLADRLVLTLINRRQLAADAFVVEEAGAVRLTDEARKSVLVAWQERKRDELRHPFFDETIPLGLVAHAQAQLLARTLRGDLDGYPAFIWKSRVLMLVAYDVNVQTSAGRRRLRCVARACLDFGQRVQNSVFECEVEPAQWTALRARLIAEIDPNTDSLRFYRLGAEGRRRVEHVGAKAALDLDGLLVF